MSHAPVGLPAVYTATTGRGFMVSLFVLLATTLASAGEPLPGTKPLTLEGDISSQLLDGAHKFVDREIERSVERRQRHWKRDFSSPEAYDKSVQPNRERLAKLLGMVMPSRRSNASIWKNERMASPSDGLGRLDNGTIQYISWPVLDGVTGRGLAIRPHASHDIKLTAIIIPDAGESPEHIVGLFGDPTFENELVVRLVQQGVEVIVPLTIGRQQLDFTGWPGLRNRPMTNREFLYRQAFEAGLSLPGLEVQSVLALVNGLTPSTKKLAIHGHGEGAWIAMAAGAMESRVKLVSVRGNFQPRENLWQQPLDRNIWGLFEEFGDAEIASLIAPRALVLCDADAALPAHNELPPGATPGTVLPVGSAAFDREVARLQALVSSHLKLTSLSMRSTSIVEAAGLWIGAVAKMLDEPLSTVKLPVKWDVRNRRYYKGVPFDSFPVIEEAIATRERLQVAEWTHHTQALIRESEYVRRDFMKDADRKSRDPAKWHASVEQYRKYFYDEVIGRFEHDLKPFNAQTRQVYDTDKYRGYEVTLDVFDDVIAYGVLLVPKDIKPGEKRPVVVCQHGLEGRPQDTIEKDIPGERYYHQFAAKLAERGFVTFAPQNLYIFKDRFRELQRKLNPLKKTLFSIIVPQHEQICRWLKSQPFVDGSRIGFYGLSYGGKTAMRVPPLVDHYSCVICSGDFNDWIRKCTSIRDPFSYVGTGEYEIWEWNLANTFNYAEMAGLICPRPFMVERGHRDGVGIDEWVDYEYAKVRLLYVDLKIPERTEIEHFDGPHEINGVGSFKFLHKHLNWPEPATTGKGS